MTKKVVIIGGVAGGASCAARLRRLNEEVEIVLLERGDHISYANCGLPYRTGGVIQSKEALLLQTPQMMKDRFNVDVRIHNEVTAIDRTAKTLTIKNTVSQDTYIESYDTLVIATGSSPVRPPISGIDSDKIMTLWTVNDTDRILEKIQKNHAKRAAVIGGGFIGLEMAENLKHAGLDVSIIEMTDQVMAPLDYEMAQLLHENIMQNGVHLHLNNGVDSFQDTGDQVEITLKDGTQIQADFVILSIGVRPNSQIAKEAGLMLNGRGGIVVDEHLVTNDPSIYAVGDVIEVEDYIFKDRTMIPLAGPANKQGRIAADNIAGGRESYYGTQGSAVAKVFDLTAASTGANEKTLLRRGLTKGKDYEQVIIVQNSHAGYYPGALPMVIKLLFSMDGKKIYGAQIVGMDGVDKRIDTIATTLRLGGSISDLENLELSYAPPYSSAKDPVNMAGFTASNVLNGLVRFSDWDVIEKNPNALLLDIREEAEVDAFEIPGAVNIPLGQLRNRFNELDSSKEIITFCAVGVRSYNAARILMNHGFANVKVYPGGTKFYRSTHPENTSSEANSSNGSANTKPQAIPMKTIHVDCSGLQCPGPIMKVFETIKTMQNGEMLEVTASDPGFQADIVSWCRRTGNTVVSNEKRGNEFVAVVMKGLGSAPAVSTETKVVDTPEGKTIIVFSGDLDKVLASFIIANGAAAMGRKVTMFFTFWGLTALRKPEKQNVKKTFIENMFGSMLPRGTGKLHLSRMNMGGMGTAMMKKIMNDKNVDSLETLMKKAMDNGIKIIACTMSMDVMGIKQDELIDGVELGGVGTYLGDAEESNVNLFI